MTGGSRGVSRTLAAVLVGAALAGVVAVMGGLLLLFDPGGPVQVGPANGAAATGPAESAVSAAQKTDDDGIGDAGTRDDGTGIAERRAGGRGPELLGRSKPTRIRIPVIGVDAAVQPVGLDDKGFIEVPPLSRPGLTGWYREGPAPGQLGPAVILGHVNTKAGPAVFARLPTLTKGDRVEVSRADGSTATFAVDEVQRVHKRQFPTARVYGNLDTAGLRLITCGGSFDTERRSFTDNIIVYATLIASSR